MKMSAKIVFDAEEVAPKEIREALSKLTGIEVTFHQHRESKPKEEKAKKRAYPVGPTP